MTGVVAEPNVLGESSETPGREHRKKGGLGGNMVSPKSELFGLRPKSTAMGAGGFEPP